MTTRAINVDGVALNRCLRPQSMEELAEMLAGAGEGGIVPMGSQTQMHFGNPLLRAEYAVDLSGMSRITEYNPADLTIHVEAGVTLERLQAMLIKNNQFLPLDPWGGPTMTIGGIAATNAQGPYRATGTIRDWIIGMRVVHADGRMSKTGGRVVKNVTGYDLAKLYTGSIGYPGGHCGNQSEAADELRQNGNRHREIRRSGPGRDCHRKDKKGSAGPGVLRVGRAG